MASSEDRWEWHNEDLFYYFEKLVYQYYYWQSKYISRDSLSITSLFLQYNDIFDGLRAASSWKSTILKVWVRCQKKFETNTI